MITVQKNFFTVLAPMRDITNRLFCDLFLEYGEPDFYVSEFLRVHHTSEIDKNIEDFLTKRQCKNPLFIQLLGREPTEFVRVAKSLEQYNPAGIDLNFGCPMPKIYKKGTGGALLNEPYIIEKIIVTLKENITLPISAKIRIGFFDDSTFDQILQILDKYQLFAVTIHARTVCGLYREPIDYEYIKRAKQVLHCLVFANGDILSAQQAINISQSTNCDGVMLGRTAIRNPYIFTQIRSIIDQHSEYDIKYKDIEHHIMNLLHITEQLSPNEKIQICLMKKYLNFIGQCIDEHGEFLYHVRRITSKQELLAVVSKYLTSKWQKILPNEPYPHLVARPNCE